MAARSSGEGIQDSPNLGGFRRKRTSSACTQCRSQKLKCTGEYPCQRCRLQNLECVYQKSKRQLKASARQGQSSETPETKGSQETSAGHSPDFVNGGHNQGAHVSSAHRSSTARTSGDVDYCLGLQKNVIGNYIDAFFRLIYPTSFLRFLHQASFVHDWHAKRIDISLLKAICACSARFRTDFEVHGSSSATWIEEAEEDTLRNIGDLSTVRLQVILLLMFYHIRVCRSSKVWMLSGLAVRLAYAKRLNYENDSLSNVDQEVRRRMMWSVFIVDRYYSGGLEELALCASNSLHIRLPSNEQSFALGLPSDAPRLHERCAKSKDMGILACIIPLVQIRHNILSTTKRFIIENRDLYECRSELQELDQELTNFLQNLPPEFRWNQENLLLRAYSPELTAFVMLHAFWHEARGALHRLTIRGVQEAVSDHAMSQIPEDFSITMRTECLRSAAGIAGIFTEILQLDLERPLKDIAVTHLTYQCAKVVTVLHNAIPVENIPHGFSSIKAIEACLEILKDLRPIFPAAEAVGQDIDRMLVYLRGLEGRQHGWNDPDPLLRQISPYRLVPKHTLLAQVRDEGSDTEPNQRQTETRPATIDGTQSTMTGTPSQLSLAEAAPYMAQTLPSLPQVTSGGACVPFDASIMSGFGDIPGISDVDSTWPFDAFGLDRQPQAIFNPRPQTDSMLAFSSMFPDNMGGWA